MASSFRGAKSTVSESCVVLIGWCINKPPQNIVASNSDPFILLADLQLGQGSAGPAVCSSGHDLGQPEGII